MDNISEQYGQQRAAGERFYDSNPKHNLSLGQSASGMADIDVSESKLRGLDAIGAGFGAIMLLGPLAAVAMGMH
jgi:hypothetical protein